MDGIRAERLDGTHLKDLIARIRNELGIHVMVDVSTFDEGLQAQNFGADLVATTFAIQNRDTPDYDLLTQLTRSLSVPVIAEGLYWTPEQVCQAFELGAHSVVVGTAITRPDEITHRFVQAIKTQLR
jgi:N-acylglucosamine-6-phosphate 2-epimerase